MVHPIELEAGQWQQHLGFAFEDQPFDDPGQEVEVGVVETCLPKGEVRKLLPLFKVEVIKASGYHHRERKDLHIS